MDDVDRVVGPATTNDEGIDTHRKDKEQAQHDEFLASRNELAGTVNRFTSSNHTTNKNN